MNRVIPLLLVLSLGADCNDQQIIPGDKNNAEDFFAEIEVTPELIDFGGLRANETDSQTVTVTNRGTANLNVESIQLQSGSAYEMVVDGNGELLEPQLLEPDQSITFDVTFSPQSVEHEGQVVIVSDDPAATRSVVELYGQGLIPALHISPNPYDFGRVEPLCERDGTVTLTNVGLDLLEIDNVAQIGDAFTLDEESYELPITLEPGEEHALRVLFLPEEVEAYDAELWVGSNAGDQVVQETGEGGPAAAYEDEWTQPESNVVDIFFYVDQSCSMEDDQERLASNFLQFTDELAELDANYQVAVSTNDAGCHNGNVIDQNTPRDQIGSIFAAAVSGPSGVWTEAGLQIARNSVQPERTSTCNLGFPRENATTTFVLVSDEPEQSPPGITWAEQVAGILTYVPSSYISAVVGPLPDGCSTAEPGTGYIEAAGMTGGIVRNICEYDWGAHLAEVARLATQVKLADTFYLTAGTSRQHSIQENTIHVYVDDVEVTEGWSFVDSNSPHILFEESAVPGEGAVIRAEYASGFVCD